MKRFLLIAGACSCSFFAAASCGPAQTITPPPIDAGPIVDAGPTFTRVCVPLLAEDLDAGLGGDHTWRGPVLGWVGAEADAPPCTLYGTNIQDDFGGLTDPSVPVVCGDCSCAPRIGTCSPPKFFLVGASACPEQSGVGYTSFNGPPGWDGGCTSAEAYASGQLCNGVPCVHSIVTSPLQIEQTGCEFIPAPVQPPITWQNVFRSCAGKLIPHYADSDACNPGEASVVAIEGAGFKQCVFNFKDVGDTACPPYYTDRRIIYDRTACGPCTCTTLSESKCESTLSIFADEACAGPLVASEALSSSANGCIDVAPGSALGSKKVAPPVFTPATCELEGGYEQHRVIVCCHP